MYDEIGKILLFIFQYMESNFENCCVLSLWLFTVILWCKLYKQGKKKGIIIVKEAVSVLKKKSTN